MAASNIMLVPSRMGRDGDSEGIPNVAKEAMALGVVCIGSSHAGIPEIVHDGETGFLFDEGDLDAFVRCTRKAIEAFDRWDEIAREGRAVMERDFDVASISKKLLTHYARQVRK